MKGDFTQSEYNPFDSPVPGQSLTDKPGNYPLEHPPQYNDVDQVLELIFDQVTNERFAKQIISMLHAGVPVEAIVRVITFSGFLNGKFNPDVGFIVIEPLMNLISAIGIRAGVPNIRLSLEDLDEMDNNFITSMSELKAAREDISQVAETIKEEAGEQSQGLMAPPAETQEELV